MTCSPPCRRSRPSSTAWAIFPRRSPKVSPKKIPETDAIFDQVTHINQAADAAPDMVRVSIDAKATVKIGPFARGGKSRVAVAAVDHDFAPEATLTPVGIFLPTADELFLSGVTSQVTRDCLMDRLAQWWETVRERYAPIPTLVLNLDHGPENPSRRPKFMQRLVDCVPQYPMNLR
jgi:hypothetical protein